MSDTAYVTKLPECDVHKFEKATPGVDAAYDGKTIRGPWANMCEECFGTHGVGLGTGRGQRLVVGEAPERDRQAEFDEASRSGDIDSMLDAIGDGDPADFF